MKKIFIKRVNEIIESTMFRLYSFTDYNVIVNVIDDDRNIINIRTNLIENSHIAILNRSTITNRTTTTNSGMLILKRIK